MGIFSNKYLSDMFKAVALGFTLLQATLALKATHLDATSDVEKAFSVCNYNRNEKLEAGE